mmetsp:Transcript_36060/g.63232  ORF Transcript_36060/g.63232 Transcript_36060/m.63232 type:complete len:105 (+) Transcript_36060:1178-1492(+)
MRSTRFWCILLWLIGCGLPMAGWQSVASMTLQGAGPFICWEALILSLRSNLSGHGKEDLMEPVRSVILPRALQQTSFLVCSYYGSHGLDSIAGRLLVSQKKNGW